MDIIGKAIFKSLDLFWSWYASAGLEWATETWPTHFYIQQSAKELKPVLTAYNNLFSFSTSGFPSRERDPQRVLSRSESNFERLRKTNQYIEQHDSYWDVRYVNDNPSYMMISYGANPKNQFIVPDPERWLTFTPYQDYTALNITELKQLAIGRGDGSIPAGSLLPSSLSGDISISDLNVSIAQRQDELRRMEESIDEVKNAKTKELAELQRQIDEQMAILNARKEVLLAELNAKKAEIEAQKQQMEQQIFILESEIYSIRCFLGETVDFLRLRSGAFAPIEEPVVLYQKLRFMDEDLGKFAIMFPDEPITGSLEDSLAKSDALRDMFLPAEKCISIVQLSKDSKVYAPHEKFRNMLEEYEDIHGHQLAILIRNGETVFIAWTDDEKIHLHDDNFFLTPKTIIEPMPEKHRYESDEAFEKRLRAEQRQNMMDGLTRHFLFSILNGVSAAENSFLPLPKFKDRAERERHIIFSRADNALEDTRFGTFYDIIKRCNSRISKGDYILTVQSLFPDRGANNCYGDRKWYNDRGIGEKNRTHDVHVWDCSIHPINLILEDPPVDMIRYTDTEGRDLGWATKASDEPILDPKCRVIERYTRIARHYFLSLTKQRSDTGARANFEVYPDEFINLTYLSSVHINYLLSSKKIAGWTVGGKSVNYSYALRYLSKALEHIKGREEMERLRIEAAGGLNITADPDWPLHLSDWKLKNNVRQISDYQAKRFVKAMLSIET